MSNLTPKVSVVTSVYNSSRYLQKSIESILNQTLMDFEFIIIDDGSTDDSWEILSTYADRDRRIRLLKNEENIGLTKSLNKGLKLAQGEYIARQDADDQSLPKRLEKQVAYLESHQSVALVASGVQYIDDKDNKLRIDIPPKDQALLHWELLFRNPLRHSAVLWRRELVACQVGNYDPSFTYTQDYDLWARIAENLTIDILSSILVEMRSHNKSLSLTKAKVQDALGTKIIHRQIKRYFPHNNLSEEDVANLRIMSRRKDSLQLQYFNSLSATHFQQAAKQYLQLWQTFRVINGLIENPLSLQAVQQEVEQSLLDLLGYCRQKRWIVIGGQLFVYYLLYSPSRTLILTLIILKRLIPSNLLFWHHFLQSTKASKSV